MKPLSTSPNHLATLDATRGAASVMIFIYHFFALYPFAIGSALAPVSKIVMGNFAYGVQVFYGVSGLSLYLAYFHKRKDPGFLRTFALRRILRIAPLFYFATAIWLAIFISRGDTRWPSKLLPTLTFVFNLIPSMNDSLVQAGWSIGVEMIFYLGFPLMLVLAASRRSSAIFLAASCVLAAFTHTYFGRLLPQTNFGQLIFPSQLPFFATGLAVYFFAPRDQFSRRLPIGLAVAFVALVWFCTSPHVARHLWLIKPLAYRRLLWVFPIGSLLALALTARLPSILIRPFAKLGDWSYSIYLLHPIVLYFLTEHLRANPGSSPGSGLRFGVYMASAFAVVLAISFVTYTFLERPCMALGKRLTDTRAGGMGLLSRFQSLVAPPLGHFLALPGRASLFVRNSVSRARVPSGTVSINPTSPRPRAVIPRLSAALGYALLCALLYWLAAARPLMAQPWQWADDGLFLRQGEQIANWLCRLKGPWMGPYDCLLLAKPPGFGMWLALVDLSGVPLRIAEFALMLPLPFLFRRAVSPFFKVNALGFAVVTVLIVGIPNVACELRLLRTGLQNAAAAGTLISAVGLIGRAFAPMKSRLRWAALTGFFFSCAYLNREESIWLLPAIGLALAVCIIMPWKTERLAAALPAFAGLAAIGICIGSVCALNGCSYGIFTTSTRRAPQIQRLYETLTQLEPEHHQHYVPIVTETRLRAYALSPAFAKLKPFLDGPPGDDMARGPHNALNGKPADSREFYSSNFEWALLKAAAYAGAADPAAAERIFGAAADELQGAIARGDITATSGNTGYLSHTGPGDIQRIAEALRLSIFQVFTANLVGPPMEPRSSGSPEEIQRMSNLTHTPLAPTEETAKRLPPSPPEDLHESCLLTYLDAMRFVYPAAFLLLLVSIGAALLPGHRGNTAIFITASGLLLVGSQFAICLIIALFDVLAAPTLLYPDGYNRLCFTPLSVMAALGVTAAANLLRLRRASPAGGLA